jgi:hypothetical protein
MKIDACNIRFQPQHLLAAWTKMEVRRRGTPAWSLMLRSRAEVASVELVDDTYLSWGTPGEWSTAATGGTSTCGATRGEICPASRGAQRGCMSGHRRASERCGRGRRGQVPLRERATREESVRRDGRLNTCITYSWPCFSR